MSYEVMQFNFWMGLQALNQKYFNLHEGKMIGETIGLYILYIWKNTWLWSSDMLVYIYQLFLLEKKNNTWLLVYACLQGVNTTTVADFKLPTKCHWSELEKYRHSWFLWTGISQLWCIPEPGDNRQYIMSLS